MEGEPVQELAAIEVDIKTHAIKDCFHWFAFTDENDCFSRRHIHGLNKQFLKEFGFPSENVLLKSFHKWLDSKPNFFIFCNNSSKEKQLLDKKYASKVRDLHLLPWAQRKDCASHQIALRFKELSIPIDGYCCYDFVHSCFQCAPLSSNPDTAIAKARHGYHCALYDVVELYYESLMLESIFKSLTR